MNALDSEKIAGNLRHHGLQPTAEPAQADVIFLNTCSVREKAVQKVYARLGELKRRKADRPELIVGVVGCMAQLEGMKVLEKAPFVSILAGPQKGQVMSQLVEKTLTTRTPSIDLHMDDDPEALETFHTLRESPWSAAVTISEGCSRQCAFCVVPQTRGRERDRESGNIIREVEELVARGYIEIVLLGQTVNSYRDPMRREFRFANLLDRLSDIKGLERIRFTSPHPSDFTDALLEVMVGRPQVCNQIHLPVQSGSSRVLSAMRRGYSRDQYLSTVGKIKAASRPIALSTDIIVGYPGEAEGDFQDTLTLLDAVQYDNIFSFKYSPRPNTAALSLPDDVPDAEKGRRLSLVQQQQKLIQYNMNAAYLGELADVLVDGKARSHFTLCGRTSNNKIVNFDGPDGLMGKIIRVQITGFSANSLKATRIASAPEGS